VKVIDVSKLTTHARTELFADFRKELSVLKTLSSCPRVVRIFGYCEMVEEQQLALLMQLAHGGTVANLLEDKSVVLTDLQKGIIIHQSAMGMEYLIDHGILHRDLKSFNLLMDKEGNIMVSYVCFTAESLHNTYRCSA
jgi:serine/threonine protein kinase